MRKPFVKLFSKVNFVPNRERTLLQQNTMLKYKLNSASRVRSDRPGPRHWIPDEAGDVDGRPEQAPLLRVDLGPAEPDPGVVLHVSGRG
jgi:hypothetical protein